LCVWAVQFGQSGYNIPLPIKITGTLINVVKHKFNSLNNVQI
jgi:hypothetical protein